MVAARALDRVRTRQADLGRAKPRRAATPPDDSRRRTTGLVAGRSPTRLPSQAGGRGVPLPPRSPRRSRPQTGRPDGGAVELLVELHHVAARVAGAPSIAC